MITSAPLTPLAARLDDLAAEHGDRPALIARDEIVSFASLAEAVRQVSAALAAAGVEAGAHVGLLMPNRPQWLVNAFAVWRRGAILVPINTLYRAAELRHALHLAEVSTLLTIDRFLSNNYVALLEEICPDIRAAAAPLDCAALPALRQILCSSGEGNRVAGVPPWDRAPATGSALEMPIADRDAKTRASQDAAIFFTSGSTAAAKGVVHTHATMLAAARNVGERLGLDHHDRTYGYLPLFFNGGLVGVALATLNRGGAVLLQDVFDAGEALDMMQRNHCTTFFGWPHQVEALLQHPSFDRARLNLRKGPGANAKWASSLLASDHSCVGTWGMSETGPMAACTDHRDPLEHRASSHGRAMPGLEIRIVDDRNRPVAPEVTGEIAVRGTSLMRTYYGRPASECFDAEGYFHTGDLGHIDEHGQLHFAGRIRDIIKTAGVNVAAAEVEQILLAHRAVSVAHVVPVPHPTRGENVAAFVVCQGSETAESEILAHCRKHLASYKVPRHVFFLKKEDLPVLGSGKLDAAALRKRAAALVAADTAER